MTDLGAKRLEVVDLSTRRDRLHAGSYHGSWVSGLASQNSPIP